MHARQCVVAAREIEDEGEGEIDEGEIEGDIAPGEPMRSNRKSTDPHTFSRDGQIAVGALCPPRPARAKSLDCQTPFPCPFAPPEGAAASSAASASPEAGATVEAPTGSDAGSNAGSQAMPAGIGALESSPPLGMLSARESGTCTSLAKAGEPCERGEVCVDGLVCRMGRCSSDPRGGAGVACERGEDCQPDLYCGRAPDLSAARDRGVCAARKPGGEACTSSIQCDGVCMSGKCAAFCGSR